MNFRSLSFFSLSLSLFSFCLFVSAESVAKITLYLSLILCISCNSLVCGKNNPLSFFLPLSSLCLFHSFFSLSNIHDTFTIPPSPPPLHPPLFPPRSPSCSVPVASCARCQSRFAQSPRRVESRVIASSVAGGFPQLFPLGTGLDKHKTGLSPPLLKHLLAHFTTVLANNAHFLF